MVLFISGLLYGQKNHSVWQAIKGKDGKIHIINTAIDNYAYWLDLAQKGIIPFNKTPKHIKLGVYKGSKIKSKAVRYEDSPDIIIDAETDNTQSENSIFIDPNDNSHVLNSNNSTDWNGSTVNTLYGTSYYMTDDASETWSGNHEFAGHNNWGDPATGIDLDGNMYIGYIVTNWGQGVAHSYDNGQTWTSVNFYVQDSQDKNHLWVDNSPSSPYAGRVYSAWSDLNSSNDILVSYSTDQGQNWSSPIDISSAVNSGSHDQGVNLATDADGNVYAVWAIYDGWPQPETAIGFAKSTDGGQTWQAATRIIDNIKGIRQENGPGGIRMNSFPVMDVGPDGTIYVVWANVGVPGTNSGSNWSIYMIKSDDGGDTWSSPIRVNQGPMEDGKHALFPWIAVDPTSGAIVVIFWDNRNTSGDDMEVWAAVSLDNGDSWEDFRISDVSFTPAPISGLAGGYFGDYIGIDILNGVAYPVWSDNRSGVVKAYCSPFVVNTLERPIKLYANIINDETGETALHWTYLDTSTTLQYFVLYRDGDSIGTTTDTTYSDFLPSFGQHKYEVAARHTTGLSVTAKAYVLWGEALISISPSHLTDTLAPNQTSTKFLTIRNNGRLPLYYNLKTEITSKYNTPKDYCAASGGGDEYISGVIFGDINNTGTGSDQYSDYTSMSTEVNAGETYQLTVQNGNPYSSDDWGVWIDFNQDGDFDDPGENVVCDVSNGNNETTYNITIPDDASAGATRMRIRLKYSGSDCGSPCGSTTYGEVEDYTVVINSWLAVSPRIDTIAPGESKTVSVTFNSTNLTDGTYYANLNFYSNAENIDTLTVPVALTVNSSLPLAVDPVAVPQNICNGESTTLYANISGGSGNYTVSWSGDDGFTSTDINPTVSPSQTTTYTLTVSDDNGSVQGTTTVYVHNVPEAPVAPTGSVNVGNHTNALKYYLPIPTPDATSYQWTLSPDTVGVAVGTTDTAYVTFNSHYTGTVYLKVKAINDCGESQYGDSLAINLFEGTYVQQNQIGLNLYPNPNDGFFKISLITGKPDIINIEIYNSLGQKVFTKYNWHIEGYNAIPIDLQSQPSGIYILHLSATDGIDYSLKFMID